MKCIASSIFTVEFNGVCGGGYNSIFADVKAKICKDTIFCVDLTERCDYHRCTVLTTNLRRPETLFFGPRNIYWADSCVRGSKYDSVPSKLQHACCRFYASFRSKIFCIFHPQLSKVKTLLIISYHNKEYHCDH